MTGLAGDGLFGLSITLVTVSHDVHVDPAGRKETSSLPPLSRPSPPSRLPKISHPKGDTHQGGPSTSFRPCVPINYDDRASDSFKRLSPFLSSADLSSVSLEATLPPPSIIVMVGLLHPLFRVSALLGLALLATVDAQSSSSSSSQTPSPSVSLSISTTTSVSNVVSGTRTLQISSVFPVTYTYSPSFSSTGTPTPTVSPTATSSPAPIRLDTKLDPGFGVLGGLLILTGIPSAFLGHKNRWY